MPLLIFEKVDLLVADRGVHALQRTQSLDFTANDVAHTSLRRCLQISDFDTGYLIGFGQQWFQRRTNLA
jgi:hypothetical protein